MNQRRGASGRDVSYAELLRVPRYLPVFLAGALSMWGDYVARVTIAAVVFERTRSPLATATTLAISFVPTFLGRSLLGPVVDRFRYKHVLVASHAARAVCVLVLLWLVTTAAPLVSIFTALFVLELIGGAASASSLVLITDLFEHDRPLYSRAVALSAMSEQLNQALGLALGGGLVALVGPQVGLLIDLGTFLVAAIVILVVVQLRPVRGDRGKGVRGFVRDLGAASADLARHPVLARLISLSAVASLGIAAPEALAIPIAGDNGWGGVLMATPIVGAVVGIIMIGRLDVVRQNSSIMPLALAMPLPLLATALEPPLTVIVVLFFVSGLLQAFMVPLQATFALATAPEMRGRIFSLAGSISVLAAGASYLGAGWVAQATKDPHLAVTICAALCLALIGLLGLRWPHQHVTATVERAYAPSRRSHAA
ncbi:MFS transporter [Intrasporangium calvum]|uniref:MFS transporter n=1 Tax=Intrasporangium calvum TaxID=53358 RepID=A0ABT5GJG3_9MICO|nr:MFS transporter [Intrasporangium calvum]MDC5698378.1 MFS transporter [Intrasporangium calvum]